MPPSTQESLARPDICVIDDNPVVTTQLERLLRRAGLGEPIVFNDPERALAWCHENEPWLVLLDYAMPRLDGLEFLHRLRSYPSPSRAFVAMVTALPSASLQQRALAAGAAELIAKPQAGGEVKEFLRAVFALAQQRYRILPRPEEARALPPPAASRRAPGDGSES